MDQATCSECSARRSTTINCGEIINPTIVDSSEKQYDVFLNFRGEDTRRNIADHLYLSLTEARINVFMDDPSLPFGEDIERELLAAIEQSKIAITIISEDYASSAGCLKELSHILRCMETGRLTVIPVFYKVNPCDIGGLRNSFERIQMHIIKYHGTIVESWKEALKRIASMKGCVVEDASYEGKIVRSIVEKVMEELKRSRKIYINHFVCVDEKAREIMAAISKDTNDVHIVGIYGMGGIGKTTVARYIYDQLLHSFDFCSFVADVQESLSREISIEELISFILDQGSVTKKGFIKDMNWIQHFFHNKKVLIVLDGIDSRIEMRILMRICSYFGYGSTIILTTRNIAVLNARKVTLKFSFGRFSFAQSMELFCKHAFRRHNPPDSFKALSNRAVEICGGLPLALEVIGSSLFGKKEVEWKCFIEKLENVPCKEIDNQLLLIYRELDNKQKQMFLDIASLPNGFNKNSLFPACEALDTEALDKLETLSLVKFDKENKLHMHDLLRDLARKILQVEGGATSVYRSRLFMDESEHLLKGSKEVFESTPLIEDVAATPTTQLDTQGYFPEFETERVKTTAVVKGKDLVVALKEPWMSKYEFSDSLKTSKSQRDTLGLEVPIQLIGKTRNSMEAEASLSHPVAHLDHLFGEINSMLAHPRCTREEKPPYSTQEAISLVDSFINQINVSNAADIDFTSPSFLQAFESLRQPNALHEVPRELLMAFHSALTCFARTPEYLDHIQSAKNRFDNCLLAQTTKVDEICNLKHELALDKDALQRMQREIALLEDKLTPLKAKECELQFKLNNAIPAVCALSDELKTYKDKLFEARAQLGNILTLQEHIKTNHLLSLHLLHEIKNLLSRKTRNQIFDFCFIFELLYNCFT